MHVGVLQLELSITDAMSLKDKRRVVLSLKDRIAHGHNVSVAEVDHQDQWQRACLGMATVSSTPGHAEEILNEVERFVWSRPDVEVISTERGWLEMES